MARIDSPSKHPAIKQVMRLLVRHDPVLHHHLTHKFCGVCDAAHDKDSRLFSHSYCRQDTICWAHDAFRELSHAQIAGICLHEIGHQMTGPMPGATEYESEKAADLEILEEFGIEIIYAKPRLIQTVELEQIQKAMLERK